MTMSLLRKAGKLDCWMTLALRNHILTGLGRLWPGWA